MACGKYIKAKHMGDDLDESIGQVVEWISDDEASLEKRGWLFCDGRERDMVGYFDLYKVIGHTYTYSLGTPTQAGYFRLPDLRDQRPKCYHSWKKYQGFREVYEYCAYCDEKRF